MPRAGAMVFFCGGNAKSGLYLGGKNDFSEVHDIFNTKLRGAVLVNFRLILNTELFGLILPE